MSNVIKAYSVFYDSGVTKTIDTHLKKEIDFTSYLKQRELTKSADGAFVEGLAAIEVETIEESSSNPEEEAAILIENAKSEAQKILEDAKKQAEQIKKDALQQGNEQGYQEGIMQGKTEIEQKKMELDGEAQRLQEEYEALVAQVEPRFVQIMISLIEKITGVIVQDKQEVVFHLVDQAFRTNDKSKAKEYTIKVSKEDFEYMTSKKSDLRTSIGREVQLNIEMEPSLTQNQCYIETDLRVINCSLDVQLTNVITDLKLLAGI